MDTRTGKIYYDIETTEGLMEIKGDDITPKQLETMQVSKYDSRSVLGQMFTGCRAERRKAMKEARREQKRLDKRNRLRVVK